MAVSVCLCVCVCVCVRERERERERMKTNSIMKAKVLNALNVGSGSSIYIIKGPFLSHICCDKYACLCV